MMNEQDFLRSKLHGYLLAAKERNPAFSLRALSRKIEVAPGSLSSFLSGKKEFSAETIEKIAYKITTNPEERKDLLEHLNAALLEKLKKTRSQSSQYDSRTLTSDEFLQLNEWYYFAFRSLLSLKDFKLDMGWIAGRLGISMEAAQTSMSKLIELGLIVITEDGRVLKTSQHLKTPDNTRENQSVLDAMTKIHAQHLDHARYSLINHSRSERDITWVNIPANSKKLDKAREIIRKFQDDMLALLEDGEEDQIMRLTVQLCPLASEISSMA